ncbi:hypothetical protein FMEAI12_6680019 [Parafrankia sp. Ea1.12]|nr:hypothetical protein FMEAI12_6680019 [Parafrankia sp. Ea1.12]
MTLLGTALSTGPGIPGRRPWPVDPAASSPQVRRLSDPAGQAAPRAAAVLERLTRSSLRRACAPHHGAPDWVSEHSCLGYQHMNMPVISDTFMFFLRSGLVIGLPSQRQFPPFRTCGMPDLDRRR